MSDGFYDQAYDRIEAPPRFPIGTKSHDMARAVHAYIRDAALQEALANNLRGPQPMRVPAVPGRNELCPCRSGKKYKRCCLNAPTTKGNP